MSRGLVFFDVDHTIIRHSSGRHFAILAIRKRMISLRVLLLIPFFYLYYRFGNMTLSSIRNKYLFFKGLNKSELEELAKRSFRRNIKKTIYPGAVALIRDLQTSGRRVILATSSLDIIVKPLTDYLGIKEILSTSLEFKQGMSTGRFQGMPLFEREKKRRVLDYIRREGFSPEQCAFYSDSIHDLPLLAAVGTPVVVNPDARLKRIAQRRGWEIIKFS
jgi:HAD superfamily hydrolase (TIGR01490 family)